MARSQILAEGESKIQAIKPRTKKKAIKLARILMKRQKKFGLLSLLWLTIGFHSIQLSATSE